MSTIWNQELSSIFTLSDAHADLLRRQQIDEEQPGSVLRDFETLLDFVGEQGYVTTSRYLMLPQARLAELNERMTHPVIQRLKRPLQKSFPNLHGLFLILRASGLGTAVAAGSKKRLMVEPESRAAWTDLNPTERYFTLLESWIVHGSPEIIAGGIGGADQLTSVGWIWQKLRETRTQIEPRNQIGLLYGTMEPVTAALMEMFGWLRLEYAAPVEGKSFQVVAIERLPLGDAMMSVLQSWLFSGARSRRDEEDGSAPGGVQSAFQPFFPEWQRNFELPETPFRDGTYEWQVSLGRASRTIVAPGELSLDRLAGAILDAFEFDRDHLYCFQLTNERGRNVRIACPYQDEADGFTDELELGDLPLPEGGSMTFHFDYGDDWRFKVKLKSVTDLDPKLTDAKVVEKKGRPPKQYGWEDDWDEDDE